MTISSDRPSFDLVIEFPGSQGIGTYEMDSIDENGYMVYKYQDPRYVPNPYVLSYNNFNQQWTVSLMKI